MTEDCYREDSPQFFQDYPTNRRVKPLPKRRRTTEPITHNDLLSSFSADFTDLDTILHWPSFTQCPQPIILPSTTDAEGRCAGRPPLSVDYHTTYRSFSTAVTPTDEDDHLDDSRDHLQQPGNKKKRKVPAAHELSGGRVFDDSSAVTDPKLDGMDESVQLQNDEVTRRLNAEGIENVKPVTLRRPRFRASLATMTGLKRKEIVKSRKRQVLAVIESLPQSDPLALEFALTAPLPWFHSPTKSRPRAHPSSPQHRPDPRPILPSIKFSEADFTFECHSPAADRIALARARAQNLKDMFERELLRQANAAEAARTPAAKTTSERKGAIAVKEGALQRKKASPPTSHAGEQQNTKTSSGTRNTPAKSEPVAVEAPAKPSKNKKKKKKGAALANASNPHHSRNYIPSRLPNSVPKSSAAVTQAGQNPISPLPIHFLSADLPRDEKNGRMVPISKAPIVKASDEWICLFCEYDLFYGWEASFRDAVKNRKKILRRRRRAREKAAMITTGFGRANSLAPSNYVEDETDEGEEYDEDEGERGQDLE